MPPPGGNRTVSGQFGYSGHEEARLVFVADSYEILKEAEEEDE